MTFYERLKVALVKSGLTGGALAQKLEIARSSITRWKHGSMPHPETLSKIAAITKTAVEWLAFGTGDTAPLPVTSAPTDALASILDQLSAIKTLPPACEPWLRNAIHEIAKIEGYLESVSRKNGGQQP